MGFVVWAFGWACGMRGEGGEQLLLYKGCCDPFQAQMLISPFRAAFLSGGERKPEKDQTPEDEKTDLHRDRRRQISRRTDR